MKLKLLSMLIAGLFAGGAMAQNQGSSTPGTPAVVTKPGAPQGRVPTAVNTPPASTTMPQRDKAVDTGVAGKNAYDAGKSGAVNVDPKNVPGAPPTAAKQAMKNGGKSMDKNMKDMKKDAGAGMGKSDVVNTESRQVPGTTATSPRQAMDGAKQK